MKAKKKSAPASTVPRRETPLPGSSSAPSGTISDPPIADRSRHLLTIAALCAITLLAYSNSFGVGFPLDNRGLILNDTRVHDATADNIGLILQHSYWWPFGEAGLYRPLTTLSYLFNYAILGDRDQPAGYHWINLLLHAGNVLLLYALALRLIRKFWPAVFIAALWAVHPASTESVTNIIGRSDLLAGIATFGGLLAYLKSTEAEGSRKIAWLLALSMLTAVGVFSKESAVTLIGVIVLYEITWWKERHQARGLIWGCVAALVPIAAMLYQRSIVLAGSPPAEFPFTDNPIAGASFWVGRFTALTVIPRYLWLTVWPANLSADYSYPQIPLATGSVGDWIGFIVVLAALAGVVVLYRANRTAFFLAMFAAVTFVPVSNLLLPIGTIMADRFLYLPSAGILACLVLAIYSGFDRLHMQRYTPVALALVVLVFTIRTWTRNPDWQDDSSLANATVRSSPRSYKAHNLAAQILFQSDPTHANIDQAIDEGKRSVALLDSLPDALSTVVPYRLTAGFYLAKGDLQQPSTSSTLTPAAADSYRQGLQIIARGIAVDEAGRAAYRGRIQADRAPVPSVLAGGNAAAYRLLSTLNLRLGDLDQAAQSAAKARASDPRDPENYRQTAQVLIAQRQIDSAVAVLITGMLVTSDPGLREALVRLYQSGLDPKGCAIVMGPNGAAINPQCETVRHYMCAASVETLRTHLQNGRRDLAESQKQVFLRDYGCPAEPLNQVMANGSGS